MDCRLGRLDTWRLLPVTEQRIQVSPTSYRIPDLCVVQRENAAEAIVRVAPVVCVEILSRDQTLNDMADRVRDYVGMGVRNIWVFDPVAHAAWVGAKEGFFLAESGRLTVASTPVRIELDDLFTQLDKLVAGRW